MARVLFGAETEYAVAGISPAGFDQPAQEIITSLMNQAHRRLVYLPDAHAAHGMFLANGSRFYVDCGGHPELATPECTNPWDVVRYIEAGHAITRELVEAARAAGRGRGEILLLRTNVDLSGAQSTWASHESYLHSSPQIALSRHLIPHLVTRVIYTGAGGFDPFSPGLRFMLSPRAAHIRHVTSEHSTNERGIWHTKSESLSRGYQRLHVLCGETTCSQAATWLRFGVTALILAMADAGLEPGNEMQLADPMAALRTVSTDPGCTATLAIADGSPLTAIGIQRKYLETAEAHLSHECMPPWAGDVCRRWEAVLASLEADPFSLQKTLDWVIKRSLYANHAQRLGMDWGALPVLNDVIENAASALRAVNRDLLTSLGKRHGPRAVAKEIEQFEPQLIDAGLSWDDLRAVLHRRAELFEIETRFSQLSKKGLFAAMDAAGVLDHQIPGVDNIEDATRIPPASGRAWVRGNAIRSLAGRESVHCDWQSICNLTEAKMLDMADPFTHEETWTPLPGGSMCPCEIRPGLRVSTIALDSSGNEIVSPNNLRQRAYDCFVNGDFHGAEGLLRECLAEHFEEPGTRCHLARVLLLMNRDEEARMEIRLAWEARSSAPRYVLARILFFRCMFATLDSEDPAAFLTEIKAELDESHPHMDWNIFPVLKHVKQRLGVKNHRFLRRLCDAISSETAVHRLERFSQWRSAGPPASRFG